MLREGGKLKKVQHPKKGLELSDHMPNDKLWRFCVEHNNIFEEAASLLDWGNWGNVGSQRPAAVQSAMDSLARVVHVSMLGTFASERTSAPSSGGII